MPETTPSTEDVREKVRGFIVDNFLFGSDDGSLTNDASFLQTGIIDSTGILEVVTFIEREYGFKVQDSEMVPENLDSLAAIAAFVGNKVN